ncbi:MAG: hypothetical protein WD767_03200 [Alphaproteobacteria bacterium]
MAFRIYWIALAAVTAALLLLWAVQPLWSALELFALLALLAPFYLPLAYRLGVRVWVARRRRLLGLPVASDRDLIDFVGGELDNAGIAWQWRMAMRGMSDGDEIEIGEDDSDALSVRVRNGVLLVSDRESGTSRFVDPVAAVDYAIGLYEGPSHADPAVYSTSEL